MRNPKQYFLHGITLALLIAFLYLGIRFMLGYIAWPKYWYERLIEWPILIVLTVICIVNVINEMRKYLNG